MRLTKLLLALLVLTTISCQYLPWGKKDFKPIFIGEQEAIIVEPPEDTFDISYRWSIIDLPDESLLVPDFSATSNLFTFTADVKGEYVFDVIVESYGDEVENLTYYFRASEDTSIAPLEDPLAIITPSEAIARPESGPVETPTVQPQPNDTPAAKPAVKRSNVTRKEPTTKKYRSGVVPGHFTIQVSSWKTAKQAQLILHHFLDEGYDAYIQRVFLEDREEVWWRVRVGDFSSVDEAKVLLTELGAKYPEIWIDNTRKEDFDQMQ